jgi:DNA-binding phage protein
MPLKTRPFDAARYLTTDSARAIFMTEALETNDPAFIAHALDVVARSRESQPDADSGFDLAVEDCQPANAPDMHLDRLLATIRELGLTLTAKSP